MDIHPGRENLADKAYRKILPSSELREEGDE